jgi:hypothetical protein
MYVMGWIRLKKYSQLHTPFLASLIRIEIDSSETQKSSQLVSNEGKAIAV